MSRCNCSHRMQQRWRETANGTAVLKRFPSSSLGYTGTDNKRDEVMNVSIVERSTFGTPRQNLARWPLNCRCLIWWKLVRGRYSVVACLRHDLRSSLQTQDVEAGAFCTDRFQFSHLTCVSMSSSLGVLVTCSDMW